jgi:hypothetical protein
MSLTASPARTLTGKIHELKCWPRYFKAIEAGEKTFEVRKLDRDYEVGDLLELREFYKPSGMMHDSAQAGYSGNKITVRITYIMRGDDKNPIERGYAILGIVNA